MNESHQKSEGERESMNGSLWQAILLRPLVYFVQVKKAFSIMAAELFPPLDKVDVFM